MSGESRSSAAVRFAGCPVCDGSMFLHFDKGGYTARCASCAATVPVSADGGLDQKEWNRIEKEARK